MAKGGEIGLCGRSHSRTFGSGDAGPGTAKELASPQSHFDEDKRRAVAGDQVDFTAPSAKIASDNRQAPGLKELGGEAFRTRAGGCPRGN